MTLQFPTIAAAYEYAHSDFGEAYLDEHYESAMLYLPRKCLIDLYTTPQASALAALRSLSDRDLETLDIQMPFDSDAFDQVNNWGVVTFKFQYDDRPNERRYAAEHGHPEYMTKTDRAGFEAWLHDDHSWFDEAWVRCRRAD